MMDMQHDESQDADLIKTVLQKIIDEMDGMEAHRILPADKRPQPVAAKVDVAMPMDDGQDENEDGLKPDVLNELLAKAGDAQDDGSMPEDAGSDLPPEIAEAVRRKKGLK